MPGPAGGGMDILARTILSLPSPILRLMSGGSVVYRGGRTLDPRLQFMAAQASRMPATPGQILRSHRASRPLPDSPAMSLTKATESASPLRKRKPIP